MKFNIFELRIFSFNSYVYYLTCGFITSTRTFNLLTRAFNLPSRAFNLATRAFSLLTCRFELVTHGFELVTCWFELVSRRFEHVTHELKLITRGFELITPGLELVTPGFELVTRGFELITPGLDLGTPAFELVTRGFELVTPVLLFHHDLYLKCDVLLLADVFKKFRNRCLENYSLCPSHYLSVPALSWDAMLNMTKVELELISDVDMYLFLKREWKVMIFIEDTAFYTLGQK